MPKTRKPCLRSAETLIDGATTPAELIRELESGCFAAGTLVHTKEGLKLIEELRAGDWVLSHPEDSDMSERSRRPKEEYTYRQVTRTFVRDSRAILEVLYFQPGSDSVKAPLRVTANHPIWSKGHGWIPAGQMKFGHTLAIGYFGNVIVRKVRQAGEITRVYNIEVDEFHTYFVEPLGVWVHNHTPRPATVRPMPKSRGRPSFR